MNTSDIRVHLRRIRGLFGRRVPKEYFLQLLLKWLHDLTGKSIMPGSLSAQDTLAAYRKINAGYGREVVFLVKSDRGIGSNINTMMTLQLYCLVCKSRFQIDLSPWFSGKDTGELKCQILSSLRAKQFIGADSEGHRVWESRQVQGLYTDVSTWHYYFPQLGIDGDIFHAKSVIAKMILQPTADITSEHRAAMEDLKPYVAVHVRRGDKVAEGEAEKIEVSEYLRKIQDVAPGVRNIFVATDDYRVVSEFWELRPDLKVVSFCAKSRKGYFHDETLKGDHFEKVWKELSVDLHYLRKADHFIGAYSSNISRLAALLRGGENCCSLDLKWHPK